MKLFTYFFIYIKKEEVLWVFSKNNEHKNLRETSTQKKKKKKKQDWHPTRKPKLYLWQKLNLASGLHHKTRLNSEEENLIWAPF